MKILTAIVLLLILTCSLFFPTPSLTIRLAETSVDSFSFGSAGHVLASQSKQRRLRRSHTRHRASTALRGHSYLNVDGERVASTVFTWSASAVDIALCRDGSDSFS